MPLDYIKVRVDAHPCSDDITDLAAAFLADAGFESFVADDSGLDAFIPVGASADPLAAANDALADFPIPAQLDVAAERVEGRDWNEEWEKHYFKPIVIEGRCAIHSSFHKDVPEADYDIVIDPKMAFGTGHHHTTSRMAAWLLELDLNDKSVIDVGTGTGILAMLAKMRGASEVAGIEIDPDAYANAVENARLNDCELNIICGDAAALADLPSADLLLANINRNIILTDIARYAAALKPGGSMLLSGFYRHDLPIVEEAAAPLGLTLDGVKESDGWVAARFRRS